MTERRDLGASGAPLATHPPDLEERSQRAHLRHHAMTWRVGLPMLAMGAALTAAASTWSLGALGFLALVLVFGGLFWIALGLMRGAYARLQGSGRSRPRD